MAEAGDDTTLSGVGPGHPRLDFTAGESRIGRDD